MSMFRSSNRTFQGLILDTIASLVPRASRGDLRFCNSQGTVFYGLHMYPGTAEYKEPDKEPYRVYLNEDTIRAMDPTFQARPVYVQHVDAVDPNLDEVRKEADGWVVESFFNAADGRHWVKFLVVSEKGYAAVKRGWKLSNCYTAKSATAGGHHNGVAYAKQITSAEYEHLAIVPNPRYEESDILTPEQFKAYNEAKVAELQRIANDDNREDREVKLKFWNTTRKAAESKEIDLETLSVELPKSKKEMTILQLVNAIDMSPEDAKKPVMANGDHMVTHGDKSMTVNELMNAYGAVCNELAELKAKNGPDDFTTADPPVQTSAQNDDEDDEKDEKKKDKKENDDEGEKDEKKKDKKENALTAEEIAEKKRVAKEKADRLENANGQQPEVVHIDVGNDKVKRGQARYGS